MKAHVLYAKLVLAGCAVPVNGQTIHSADSVFVVQASRCTACLRCAVPKQGASGVVGIKTGEGTEVGAELTELC